MAVFGFETYGGISPIDNARLLTLENNELKILYFATVNAASGTITVPTDATVILNDFPQGLDAIAETIINGVPTGLSPSTAGGVPITVSSFDTSGNYTLSGVPSAYPVAILYVLKIKAINYSNLNFDNIIESQIVDAATVSYVDTGLAAKQNTLVSGINIKTVNGITLLGPGNLSTLQTLAQTLATGAITNSIPITSNNAVNSLLLDNTSMNLAYSSGAVTTVLSYNSSGWQFGSDNASSHYFNFGYSHSSGALTIEGNDTFTFQNFSNLRFSNMAGISASTLLYTNATKDIKSVTLGSNLTFVAGVLSATGGGDALTTNPLSQFASTTSAQLFGVMSDKTGTGVLVFATTPTLVTPVLGVATATSINKVIFTAPTTTATLTLANNTTTSITGGGTLALATFTLTVPATGTATLGSPGAAGRVFVGSSATAGAGSTTLTYASNAFQNTISVNGELSNRVTNSNSGALAYVQSFVSNGTAINSMVVFGTGYTAAGLLVANLISNQYTTAVGQLSSLPTSGTFFKWAIGGTALSNEVWRIVVAGLSNTKADATASIHLKANAAVAGGAGIKYTLTSAAFMTVAESGAIEMDSTGLMAYTCLQAYRGSVGRVGFTQTANKTVTNTIVETSIIGTGVTVGAGLTMPANFPIIGRVIRFRIGGIYTSTIASSIIIKVKLGATIIATVTTSALASGTNLEFDGEIMVTYRTIGATGTVMVHGDIEYVTGIGTIAVDSLNNAGAVTTVDTTASALFDVTIQWDSATASRSVTATSATLEILN